MAETFSGAVQPSSIEQAVYDGNLKAFRHTEVPSGQKMRIDYGSRTDGQPDYQGFAPAGLAEGSNGWLIYKFTYTADPGSMTQRDIAGVLEDANWTGRAGYDYDA